MNKSNALRRQCRNCESLMIAPDDTVYCIKDIDVHLGSDDCVGECSFRVDGENGLQDPISKVCACCGKAKPISEFYAAKSKAYLGLDSFCKECRNERRGVIRKEKKLESKSNG